MKNARPCLQLSLCRRLGVECPRLANYVVNRDWVLEKLSAGGCDDPKKLILVAVNGSHVPRSENDRVNQFFSRLRNEAVVLYDCLVGLGNTADTTDMPGDHQQVHQWVKPIWDELNPGQGDAAVETADGTASEDRHVIGKFPSRVYFHMEHDALGVYRPVLPHGEQCARCDREDVVPARSEDRHADI